MKKKISIMLSTIVLIMQLGGAQVLATENISINSEGIIENIEMKKENSNTNDEEKKEETENKDYEILKKPIIKTYLKDKDIEEEVKKDFEFLSYLKYLIPKTKSEYEIVEAHSNGNYTYLDKSEDLNEAMDKVHDLSETLESESHIAILNAKGQIIYSPLAMGKIIKYVDGVPYPSNNKNTDIYKDSNLQQKLTYINHGYVDDVPIIEDNGTSAKIQVAGATGWVNKDSSKAEFDMVVVPLNQVTNPCCFRKSAKFYE